MNRIARRKSGISRQAVATNSTRQNVRSTIEPKPSINAPLPGSSARGRQTTLGVPGCSTLRKATPPESLNGTSRPPKTSERLGLPPTPASNVRTVRSSLAQKPRVPPTRPISSRLPPARQPPTRPSPQLSPELIRSREQCAQLQEQLELLRGKNELLTDKIGHISTELENSKELIGMLKEQLRNKTQLSENLANQLNSKEAEMRKLHNAVVDLRGQIRVVLRVRPCLPSDKSPSSCVTYPAVNAISIQNGSKNPANFAFERVFTEVFSQQEVFDNISDFVLSALHGFNVGLIAFGQTGSGKTHTMRGGHGDACGAIPRAASLLFAESEKLKAAGWDFEFVLSFLEIYNNAAFDLLDSRKPVTIRLNGQEVKMDGLSEHRLERLSDMDQLLCKADNNRKTAATKCNEQSSRSHAVYMWQIKARQSSTGLSTTSLLKLVDLAGSERAKESGVTGQQFNEMTAINNSLSVLQKCVNLQKSKATHVPYRESKLTQVLMDCLGRGSSKTMVIVNINPCAEQVLESKRSVEFAAKMRETHVGTAVQQRDVVPT